MTKPHELTLDGPLGDRVIYTGLPEAYHRLYNKPLRVGSTGPTNGYFWRLYDRNPYVEINRATGPYGHVPKNLRTYARGFTTRMYRPSLVFFELTGVWLAPTEVNPNLYLARKTIHRRCIVCDEVRWESRRGYPYLNKLVAELRRSGWETILMRNLGMGPQQVTTAQHYTRFTDYWDSIELMRTASLYVGYESGMGHVAGALDVPYVLFCGASPAESARHRSCIYAYDACSYACWDQDCPRCCLYRSPDLTDEILAAIAAYETGT